MVATDERPTHCPVCGKRLGDNPIVGRDGRVYCSWPCVYEGRGN